MASSDRCGQSSHASTDGAIPVILIIDRDYRSKDEVLNIKKECEASSLILRCWDKKEIENYLISSSQLHRLISNKQSSITVKQIDDLIDAAAEKLRQYTIETIADQWHLLNRRESVSTAMKKGKSIFSSMLKDRHLRDIVSGKRLISEASKLCKERWNVSFAPMTLCRDMKIDDFPDEFRATLNLLLK